MNSFKSNLVKDGFPFAIWTQGCFVHILNGLSGLIKIHQDFIFVDNCCGSLSVFCDGSDEKDFIEIFDISKKKTGFDAPKCSLNPSDFGFDNKSGLINALSVAAVRDISVSCCGVEGIFSEKNEKSVFCGASEESNSVSFAVIDGTENISSTALITSIGKIPVPSGIMDDNSLFVEWFNEWLSINGMKGSAELNPTDVNAPFVLRDLQFGIISVERTFGIPFSNNSSGSFGISPSGINYEGTLPLTVVVGKMEDIIGSHSIE